MSNMMWKLKLLWFYRRQWIPLFKAGLYVFWFLWILQFYQPFKEVVIDEIQYQKNRNPEIERQNLLEVIVLAKSLIKDAEASDIYYSPANFFSDLRNIKMKCRLGERPIEEPIIYITQLRELFLGNVKRGHFDQQEVSEQWGLYRRWLKENDLEPKVKKPNWKKAPSWLSLLYLRTMFLAAILYFARMGERKGILATILADKKRFVLAVVAWPVFLYKYPYNIVREIRVEAELRRIKGLFRKLSLKEVGLIREIANGCNYHLWINNYRRQHKAELQKGLFVAILATLFIYIFFMPFVKTKVRSSIEKIMISAVSIETSHDFQQNDNSEHHNFGNQYVLMEEEFPEKLLFLRMVRFVKESFLSRCMEALDNIPRNSLFGVVNRLINQTVKGIKNECNKGFPLFSDTDVYQFSLCSQSC